MHYSRLFSLLQTSALIIRDLKLSQFANSSQSQAAPLCCRLVISSYPGDFSTSQVATSSSFGLGVVAEYTEQVEI